MKQLTKSVNASVSKEAKEKTAKFIQEIQNMTNEYFCVPCHRGACLYTVQ